MFTKLVAYWLKLSRGIHLKENSMTVCMRADLVLQILTEIQTSPREHRLRAPSFPYVVPRVPAAVPGKMTLQPTGPADCLPCCRCEILHAVPAPTSGAALRPGPTPTVTRSTARNFGVFESWNSNQIPGDLFCSLTKFSHDFQPVEPLHNITCCGCRLNGKL